MNNQVNKSKFIWPPRVLAILYILFISIFALDIFVEEAPFGEKFVGFIIHLIPSFVLLILLLISWKYPLIGGSLFIIISVVITLYLRLYEIIFGLLILSIPIFLIGVLFILSNYMRRGSQSSGYL